LFFLRRLAPRALPLRSASCHVALLPQSLRSPRTDSVTTTHSISCAAFSVHTTEGRPLLVVSALGVGG